MMIIWLYDDDVLDSRLKKHQVFPVMRTTSGSVHDDHARAYRIGTCFGLNMLEGPFKFCIKVMKELMKKTKSNDIFSKKIRSTMEQNDKYVAMCSRRHQHSKD